MEDFIVIGYNRIYRDLGFMSYAQVHNRGNTRKYFFSVAKVIKPIFGNPVDKLGGYGKF